MSSDCETAVDQIKRQISLNQSSDINAKKSRTVFDEKNIAITCLEDLSNELFYEIFEYLDGYDLYEPLSNLNIRFQYLLDASPLLLKINSSSKSKSPTYDCHAIQFIVQNRHRIISLGIDACSMLSIIDPSFIRLESLILHGIAVYRLTTLLINLARLPRLFSLSIGFYSAIDDLKTVYQIIFRLPFLKSLSLTDCQVLTDFTFMNTQFSTIEHLIINYRCTPTYVLSLLSFTPRLRRLTCGRLEKAYWDTSRDVPLTLYNLTDVSIAWCRLSFYDLENLIKRLSSRLQTLRITDLDGDADYLSAGRWERFILQHIPHLRKFEFNHGRYHGGFFNINKCQELINRFRSPFWIERGWIIGLKINADQIIYSVHSQRKWFDCDSNGQADQKSTPYLIISNQQEINESLIQHPPIIVITDQINRCYNKKLILNNITSLFTSVPLTCVFLHGNEQFISTMIKIIYLSPTCTSLQMLKLSLPELQSFSEDDANMLRSIMKSNKIMKMTFGNMSECDHVLFLVDPYPQIQFIEINCLSGVNFHSLVRFILIKHARDNSDLRTLCLCILEADDVLVKKLQQMIDREELLNEYNIKRIRDKIYLKWTSK